MKKAAAKTGKALRVFLFVVLLVIIGCISVFSTIYFGAKLDADSLKAEKADIKLYAADNTEIESEFVSRYVKYDDISPNIINAFVALEDKRYFKHHGIDYYRSAGAVINNIKAGYKKEGGSTITQQLAKNTMLSSEKTITRKIKELKLARDIEKQFSKEEIMEMYLNAIYFGNGMYGIDSACRNYFNKSPADIDVAEAAYLAGIVKSPKNYSPISNLEKSTERKNLVLKLMKEQGILDEYQYEKSVKYVYAKPEEKNLDLVMPYWLNAIVEGSQILGIGEKELMKGGYKIYTYFDKSVQNILYNAFLSGEYECVNDAANTASYSALLADNRNGGIAAYYCNFNTSLYNFRRQPASTIKPTVVYAPALEAKVITPASPVLDQKINIKGYSPENYGGNYLGWTDVKTALTNSSNSVSVSLLNEIGVENGKITAQKMGITFSEKDTGLSIALGGLENGVNFVELNSAYMSLANGGNHTENTFIKAIYDKNNRLIYSHETAFSRAVSEETAFLVTDMLCQTAKDGTARKLGGLGLTIAAKTGTNTYPQSKNNLDAWCVSFTPDVTLSVWYGTLENTAATAVSTTGGNYPALLSAYIYRSLNLKDKPFAVPEGIVSLDIDSYARDVEHKLYLSNMYTPEECIKNVYFDSGNVPGEYSPYFDLDSFEFSAENDENGVNIIYKTIKPYSTKLFRRNMLTNEITEIPTVDAVGQVNCADNPEEFCVYDYYVEFYYGDKKMPYTFSEIVFT